MPPNLEKTTSSNFQFQQLGSFWLLIFGKLSKARGKVQKNPGRYLLHLSFSRNKPFRQDLGIPRFIAWIHRVAEPSPWTIITGAWPPINTFTVSSNWHQPYWNTDHKPCYQNGIGMYSPIMVVTLDAHKDTQLSGVHEMIGKNAFQLIYRKKMKNTATCTASTSSWKAPRDFQLV